MLEVKKTKFQDGTLFPSQAMSCQVHAIGKIVKPIFTDLVTHIVHYVLKCYNLLDSTNVHTDLFINNMYAVHFFTYSTVSSN